MADPQPTVAGAQSSLPASPDGSRRRLAASIAAGAVVGLVGPVLAIAGAVPVAVGLGIAAPLYAVGHLVAHAATRRSIRPDPPAATPTRDDADEILAALDQLHGQVTGVPATIEARVDRIVTTIRETVPRLDRLGAGSTAAYDVLRIATSYLPEALAAYLRLPRSFADNRPVSNGKSSLAVLCDQLDLLASRMDQVFDAVCRADADALVAHGRFLAEKFGAGELALDPLER